MIKLMCVTQVNPERILTKKKCLEMREASSGQLTTDTARNSFLNKCQGKKSNG